MVAGTDAAYEKTYRENKPALGALVRDFNFKRRPRAPVILHVCPKTDLVPKPHC
jgi:hypothetical protein